MLDHYLHGHVHRMSPEAPVPVVTHQTEEFRLGGAANVALNLEGLGMKAELVSIVGPEMKGTILKELASNQLSACHLLTVENRVTTTKMRVVDKHQQLLRIDQEVNEPIDDEEGRANATGYPRARLRRQPSTIVLSDYNKES